MMRKSNPRIHSRGRWAGTVLRESDSSDSDPHAKRLMGRANKVGVCNKALCPPIEIGG